MPDAETDWSREAALLAETVREAAVLAIGLFGTNLQTWTKGVSSPVSEADIAVNDFLEQRLRSFRPDYGWLSEESLDDLGRLEKSRVWVVDPIDGTRAYINGQHDWSISVALVNEGLPVVACVFAPMTDEFFFARRGAGATMNADPIAATKGTGLDLSRITGPKSILERISPIAEGTNSHPRIGSLALRLCRVADGYLDVAVAGGNSRDWDNAAADLIVHEAGGTLTELSGEPLRYNRCNVTHGVLIAAGAERHQRLIQALNSKPVF
ncbi:MAG: 3'(2'),5'-bisphosphate nucleotidase CysQ [Xanthobacteraceae bacterium]|nr:3'(2'),5'-bisphosphate nucleotidase CysQ [Xanthobacteraceae bacterium]